MAHEASGAAVGRLLARLQDRVGYKSGEQSFVRRLKIEWRLSCNKIVQIQLRVTPIIYYSVSENFIAAFRTNTAFLYLTGLAIDPTFFPSDGKTLNASKKMGV
jgi:hypothetical protein